MKLKLRKSENSHGLRITNIIMKSLKLKTIDIVELIHDKDKFGIKKLSKKREMFEDTIKNYKGENLSKEFLWDKVKGKEI